MSIGLVRTSLVAVALLLVGCTNTTTTQTNRNAPATPSASPGSSPIAAKPDEAKANAQVLTFPILDAFLTDPGFSDALKSRTRLTDDEVSKLKELAHAETSKLNENSAGTTEGETANARAEAQEKVGALIGPEKTEQLAALVRERWNDGSGAAPAAAGTKPKVTDTPMTAEEFEVMEPNSVPSDSRVVVNAPAFRMDVFENGQLVKSYKVGIGYPQFPLPTALRKARTIIFNPTWTPPDEPWVSKMKNVSVGQVVEAGSALNPLGPIKIPIGAPSLIHGGKPLAKIGTFASHGCVGLTTPQVRDFAKLLARIGGSQLTDAALERYAQDKTQTRTLKLAHDVPVELRYETIVVEDGKLHIYRDVYDQDSNTEEELRSVLEKYNVKLEDLSQPEQDQIFDALGQMAGKSTKKIVRPAAAAATPGPSPSPSPSSSASPSPSPAMGKNAKATKKPVRGKNLKEIVIEVAALNGKGYPAPVDLDTGAGRASKKVK